ncbi:MAG: muscular protein 20, partial [Piptocephalis tieghemiana]
FLEDVLGEDLPHPSLFESLRDGVLLCRAANIMRPGLIQQISRRPVPFLQMENISNFLIAARTLGVPEAYLFSTVDLFEAKNLAQVATTLLALARSVYQYK